MQHVEVRYQTAVGQAMGTANIADLSLIYFFKGKLRAAARRAKFYNSADLRWLEHAFPKQATHEFVSISPSPPSSHPSNPLPEPAKSQSHNRTDIFSLTSPPLPSPPHT